MMIEKRFRKLMGFIQDNTCEGDDVDGVMDLTEIEDMLNKLNDENEQLKILLITEVVPQLIFLTGLTDFNGKEINFSSLIEKIEKVCDVV